MKLLLYDKFWDSFLKLNKTTQKKVIEFQKKFRDNSQSAAIHLEPISTFRDASLRTARIDQKYRAIIKAPETGTAYYLLWVDNHDEAMDWAKNKVFQWNQSTQSMQVFTAPEEEIEPIVPVSPPIEGKIVSSGLGQYHVEELTQLGVPEILLPSVRKINTMDDLEAIEKYLPTDVFETLFYLLDGADVAILINEIQEGRITSTHPDEMAASPNNQRSFIELTDDELFNEALSGKLEKWKYYLHPSQRKYVNGDFRGPVKITGGAGTGKTVAALHRLKFLSDFAQIDHPILFTTFTKALTQNLVGLAEQLKIPKDRIRITHIDSLAFEMAKKYELIDKNAKVFGLSAVTKAEEVWEGLLEEELVEYDKDFLQQEFEKVVLYHDLHELRDYLRVSRLGRGKPLARRQRAALWKLFQLYRERIRNMNSFHKEEIFNLVTRYLIDNQIYPFSHAVVDELQDFSNVELRFVRSLVAEKANDLFLVGDPLQTIYNKHINFSQVGINIRGKRSRRLRINYRTTEEIKKLAVSIIEDCHYDNFDGEEEEKKGYVSLYHGQKPTYELFKTKQEEVKAFIDKITLWMDEGVEISDIAIASRTRSGLKDFSDALYQHKIPFYEMSGEKRGGDKSGVNLCTLHSIKGLEFHYVILVDVNNRTAPKLFYGFGSQEKVFQEQYLRAERSLLYVAATRAIKSLSIMGTGIGSDLVKV